MYEALGGKAFWAGLHLPGQFRYINATGQPQLLTAIKAEFKDVLK